jgi:hypothetical protein
MDAAAANAVGGETQRFHALAAARRASRRQSNPYDGGK